MAADTPAPASPAATEMAQWPRVEMLHDGTILTQLGPTSRTELSTIAAATALRDRLAAYLDLPVPTPDPAALRAERDRLLRFLSRAFAVLDLMAGEGMVFAGVEDPSDILMEYAATVDPEADYRDILKALAARAALAEGRADG